MTLLLDTHAALWWWTDSHRISSTAAAALGEGLNMILVSAVTAYELAGKCALGKLPEAVGIVDEFDIFMETSGFTQLPISSRHALNAGLLPGPHRDPFDRLLIAQAKLEQATLVTLDPVFATYGVSTLW